MIPVYTHSHSGWRGVQFRDLEMNLRQICEQHHKEGRALVFAFILYNLGSPQIAKILKDDDYWVALNKVAGDLLSVFVIHAPHSAERLRATLGFAPPDPASQSNRIINAYFPSHSEPTSPAILFFQVSEGNISNAYLVPIEASKVEDAFEEIREVLQLAADSLRQVKEENRGNAVQLFYLVQGALQHRKLTMSAKRIAKRVVTLGGFISIFR